MQELKCVHVIIKQRQNCKTNNECVRLLGVIIIKSEVCIATKTQQLYPYSSHV
jgi:hypothetical protein